MGDESFLHSLLDDVPFSFIPLGQSKFFLYDGGRKRKSEPFTLLNTIKSKCTCKKIDGIVVSHPDDDHVGGIVSLYESEAKPTCPILLTSLFFNCKSSKKTIADLFKKLEDNSYGFGEYNDRNHLHKSIHFLFHEKAPGVLCTPQESPPTKKVKGKQKKKSMPQDYSNESSIILKVRYLNKTVVCLTGDAPGGRVVEEVKDEAIEIFQVSHHGSKNNSHLRCNDSRLCRRLVKLLSLISMFIDVTEIQDIMNLWTYTTRKCEKEILQALSDLRQSLSNDDKETVKNLFYGVVREALVSKLPPKDNIIVKLKSGIDKMKKIKAQRQNDLCSLAERFFSKAWKKNLGILKCKWFFNCIKADTYFIPSGTASQYRHPNMEVINGIALAAVEKNRKCQIIVARTKIDSSLLSDVFLSHKDLISLWQLKDSTMDYFTLQQHQLDNEDSALRKVKLTYAPSTRSVFWDLRLLARYDHNRIEQNLDSFDPKLPKYLENIGHQGNVSLYTLLEYILGSAILKQLGDVADLKDLNWKMLSTWKVSNESNFELSSTGISVISGNIQLEIPEGESVVESVTIMVEKPRTRELDLSLQVGFKTPKARTESFSLLHKLNFNGSCGLLPADYLAERGVDKEKCVKVAEMSVGEILAGLLYEHSKKFELSSLARGFTDFFPIVMSYKIHPLETVINFKRQGDHLEEAHLVASVHESSRISLAENINLQVLKAAIHLYPSYETTECIGLTGEVIFNDHQMSVKSFWKLNDCPDIEFTLNKSFTISETLQLFGINHSGNLHVPFTEQELKKENRLQVGFRVQQLFLRKPQVSCIFFVVDWFSTLPHYWPACLKDIKKGHYT